MLIILEGIACYSGVILAYLSTRAPSNSNMSFLTMPLEVRLKVYSFTFGHGEQVIEANDQDTVWGTQPEERSAPLLFTSKAVRKEAIPIFYNQTIVQVARKLVALECLDRGCSVSCALTREVRHLAINFNPMWFEKDGSCEDLVDFASTCLPNIEDITLSCFAFRWSPSWYDIEEDRWTYEKLLPHMRTLAVAMLAMQNLTELREQSIPGKKMVINIWRPKGQAVDDGVRNIRYLPRSIG